jgi:hypothetical protein
MLLEFSFSETSATVCSRGKRMEFGEITSVKNVGEHTVWILVMLIDWYFICEGG